MTTERPTDLELLCEPEVQDTSTQDELEQAQTALWMQMHRLGRLPRVVLAQAGEDRACPHP